MTRIARLNNMAFWYFYLAAVNTTLELPDQTPIIDHGTNWSARYISNKHMLSTNKLEGAEPPTWQGPIKVLLNFRYWRRHT